MEKVTKKPAPRDIPVVNPESVHFCCEWKKSRTWGHTARGVMSVMASVFGWEVEIETTARAARGCGYDKEGAVFEACAAKAREKAAKLFGVLLALPVGRGTSPERQLSAIFGRCTRWERLEDNSYNYQSDGRFRPGFSGLGEGATWEGREAVRQWNGKLDYDADAVRKSKVYKANKAGGALVPLLGYGEAAPRFVRFAFPEVVTIETDALRAGHARYHVTVVTEANKVIEGRGDTPQAAISDAAFPSLLDSAFLALPLLPEGLTVDDWGEAIFKEREEPADGIVRFFGRREKIDFDRYPAMLEGMESQLTRCASWPRIY